MDWYVLHALSGHENKVKNFIETQAPLSGLGDLIGQVVVPTEDTVEMKDGKKKTTKRKFLPSYILIEMELTSESQYFVSNIPGVTSFVGPGRRPEKLKEVEVERILGQISSSKEREVPAMKFDIGDRVKVIDGPFTDFTGEVEEVNPLKSKVKVTVSIFGRPTPVELNVLQIEKSRDNA
ncbi:MAG: transcription termination/antitermination factor NusG [Candidatus Latescibacteria bacterium]|nr:transcription termination/antitermination factor NusG [Candidatus Latescibacterota bacterium]